MAEKRPLVNYAGQTEELRAGDTLPSSGSGGYSWVVKTANYTAVNNEGVLANTTAGIFTATLPPTPVSGDKVMVSDGASADSWGTNNLTVGRNGSTIEGNAANFVCDVNGGWVEFVYDGATWQVRTDFASLASGSPPLPPKSISNLLISRPNTKDINITVGKCRDASDSVNIELITAMGKQLDAPWATGGTTGTPLGGLFSGTIAANTWYHVFLIQNNTTGAVDAGFDTSLTAANIPTGYSSYRRIGSIRTDASSNILNFDIFETSGGGIDYIWKTAANAFNAVLATTATLVTLQSPPGLNCKVTLSANLYDSGFGGAIYVYISSPASTDAGATGINAQSAVPTQFDNSSSQVEVITDTSSRVRIRASNSLNTFSLTITAFKDER